MDKESAIKFKLGYEELNSPSEKNLDRLLRNHRWRSLSKKRREQGKKD